MGKATFEYTGSWQTLTVPDKVTDFQVTVFGAASGETRGAKVTGLLRVNHNVKSLHILVGQRGGSPSGSAGAPARVGGGGRGGSGNGHPGGWSGGGATSIRINSNTGALRVVAAGAGGASGDVDWTPTYDPGPPVIDFRNVNGRGGRGGAAAGEHGFPGVSTGDHPTGFANAGGGTQSQGGVGGRNSQGTTYDGGTAANTNLAAGGAGGSGGSTAKSYGGGGGGGGFKAGGGGQAGTSGNPAVPAGGGGGGSSYVTGLIGGQAIMGGGPEDSNGQVVITWVTPAPANQPPTPPTDIKLDNHAYTAGMATMANTHLTVTAMIDDPDKGDKVRLLLKLSKDSSFSKSTSHWSKWYEQTDSVKNNPKPEQRQTSPVKATIELTTLTTNVHYYGRLYTKDEHGKYSTRYTSINFFTDRSPLAPTNLSPVDGSQFTVAQNVPFMWKPQDPDPNKTQRGFQLHWRVAAQVGKPDNAWEKTITQAENRTSAWTVAAGTFKSNTAYQWQVKTRDTTGAWGPFSALTRFYVSGPTTPPTLVSPINETSVITDEPVDFVWKYQDPRTTTTQLKADIQWRKVGAENWTTRRGAANPGTPGSNQHWTIEEGVFLPNVRYEWQVKTYNTASSNSESEWSNSGYFHAIPGIGSGIDTGEVLPDNTTIAPPLGCGQNRVYVYERGGKKLVGEINPITTLQWTRKRDDISTANITTNGFSWDCGQMLADIRCWQHELVIFRDGVRVWEGPITRVGYFVDHVEIEAKDVMAYLYRRILRNGYNDAYQTLNGVSIGGRSVVDRATQIAVDCLAYDNPNLIEYITPMTSDSDARQSRIVLPYSRTAWEEIDDLAATAGLDYTVAGRRMMFWDTHEPVGLLPEMRDGDFSESPVVTEYGMNLCNYFAVTNGSGVWGAARAPDGTDADGRPLYYGWVEQLASAYGESAGGATNTLTSAALADLKASLNVQASRNIAHRWPSPVVVRVPDNATLNPEINVGINQLIPGVYIPLRASGTLRPISQIQKLDSITVSQDSGGEKVAVVMSPAPGSKQDFDADDAAAEAE